MIAVPFIQTMLNDKYRELVSEPFIPEQLVVRFKDWQLKDMVGWTKATNFNTESTIEFYGKGNSYKIKNPKLIEEKIITLPYPRNLDDFICDCYRCLVDLHWTDTTIENHNRIHFMVQSEIEKYNNDLLRKIEKI